jgi:hypothetical protein
LVFNEPQRLDYSKNSAKLEYTIHVTTKNRCKNRLKKVPHLVYDRVKDFAAQKVPRNGKFSVEQANLGVIWVFHIEAREVEHGTWTKG